MNGTEYNPLAELPPSSGIGPAAALIQILLVEDSPTFAQAVHHSLRGDAAGSEVEITHVTRLDEALRLVQRQELDVILLDLTLPDTRGLETARRMHAAAPTVPIVVLTGSDDDTLGLQAIREGIQDYLVKTQTDLRALPRVVRYAMERKRADSDRLRLMQQLQETVADLRRTHEVKDAFLSIVTHDLRTPLQVILGFADLLREGTLPQERASGAADMIYESGVTQLKLIDNLLDFAALEAGHLRIETRATDVGEVVDSCINMLRVKSDEKKVGLTMALPPGLPQVEADPERLLQVMTNLVANALKFTPASGRITVQAEVCPNGYVQISVSDTGIGIARQDWDKVFQRFGQVESAQRYNKRGTGLGLFITSSLVEAQGGRIWLESEAGKGTTFHFTLPPAG